MVKWLWWFLILDYMGWPFVLQFSSSPLDFFLILPLRGCLRWWGRFRWPWGKFIFCSALLLAGSIVLTLRHDFNFCSALTSIGSISLSLRHDFDFCSALTSIGSISLTLRHDFDFSPYWVPAFVRSISVTLRQIYFLQCASFGGVDRFDPEARIWFFYSALASVGSISLTLRHKIIFYSGSLFWHPDSGLFGNFGRR